MPIDIERPTAAIRSKRGILFRGDPDPVNHEDLGYLADNDYYNMRKEDPLTQKPVADHNMTHTLFISSQTR